MLGNFGAGKTISDLYRFTNLMNDFIYFEDSRNLDSDESCNLTHKCKECIEETGRCIVRTASELHEAMMKEREPDFDDEPFDPIESELDVYNL